MPEGKEGKPVNGSCPNCGQTGTLRITGDFIQCCGHYEERKNLLGKPYEMWINNGCGYGWLKNEKKQPVSMDHWTQP